MPLVGVLAFIERCEERVQDTVIALEYLIQQHNVRLGDLAYCLDDWFAWTQQRYRFAVGCQLVRGPIKHSKFADCLVISQSSIKLSQRSAHVQSRKVRLVAKIFSKY